MSDETLTRLRSDLLSLADFAAQRLFTRLDGLTDEEYLWEPAPGCWSVRPGPDGRSIMDGGSADPPPLTTIAWRVCHVIDLLAAERNATWLGLRPLRTPRTPRTPETLGTPRTPGTLRTLRTVRTVRDVERDGEPASAAEAQEQLRAAYQLFREHVAAAEPAALMAPMGRVAGYFARDTRTAFVLHELDELIHHGAEIALMRDLYRALGQPFGTGAGRATSSV